MISLGRDGQLKLMPTWMRRRIEINRFEIYKQLEQAQAEIPAGARFLDAGSGEGQFTHLFDHTNYTGIDLAVGDKNWDYTGLDTQGDLRSLPFPDNTFDGAICIQTMEHVDEPFIVTAEIARVLKPGGRYYVSAPQSWHQHQKPHDFFRYTSFGFRHLLEKSGFKVIDVKPWGGYFWFLSFNLQILHTLLFPKPKNSWLRILQLPFEIIVQLIFFIILPLILYHLDWIDKNKDYTLGWSCVAEKL